MKKLLGLLLAMTMAWPVTASAEVLKNVDLKGEIQTIASDARHDKTKRINPARISACWLVCPLI